MKLLSPDSKNHCNPYFKSSSSETSAMVTSIKTCKGIMSRRLSVVSIMRYSAAVARITSALFFSSAMMRMLPLSSIVAIEPRSLRRRAAGRAALTVSTRAGGAPACGAPAWPWSAAAWARRGAGSLGAIETGLRPGASSGSATVRRSEISTSKMRVRTSARSAARLF